MNRRDFIVGGLSTVIATMMPPAIVHAVNIMKVSPLRPFKPRYETVTLGNREYVILEKEEVCKPYTPRTIYHKLLSPDNEVMTVFQDAKQNIWKFPASPAEIYYTQDNHTF